MSQPQLPLRLSSANGVGRRRVDRDVGNSRADAMLRSDSQNWRSSQGSCRTGPNAALVPGLAHGPGHFSSLSNNNATVAAGANRNSGERVDAGTTSLARVVSFEQPLHDRLLFMAMCLIGHPVEVQVKNGSFYSGIFHTADLEKDFGIVLRMARLTKDGSVKGGRSEAVREAARKPPLKTLIIHAKDFVQIIAKDVSLTGDALPNGRARENRTEIVTDAGIVLGRQRDGERELKPWKPDDEAPRPMGLESTFQSSWHRSWDQFETNKTLFGVETTFNEELYTTKLERGPQMREREREAVRIAREIEGTTTKNFHQAEERGIRLTPELDAMDEESRFSSVIRHGDKIDVGEDGEDRHMDDRNEETFGTSLPRGASLPSPSDSSVSVSIPLSGESESKPSCPSSTDSNQIVDGLLQKDPLYLLQERRTSSIEKGEGPILEDQADTHREHLRLRHLLVGDKSKRSIKGGSSAYQSPVGRGSPLHSALVGDAASIQALNLDPSCPQVPEEVYREFHEFKLQKTAEKGKKQREDQVNELKSFSESLKKKELEPRSPRAASKLLGSEPISSTRHTYQEAGARQAVQVDCKSTSTSTVPAELSNAQASAPPASALPIPTALGSQSNVGSPALSTSLGSSVTLAAAGHSSGILSHNELPAVSSLSGNFAIPTVILPISPVPLSTSPAISPTSSVSSVASGAPFGSKKFTLNPNAKEFKLNPNAKVFTPNFLPRPASPMIQSPVFIQGLPPGAQMQGLPVGMNVGQYMQQPGQPSQFTQYSNVMAAAAAAASSPQYMHSPGGYVPGAGVSPVLTSQPGLKMQPHSQQQVVGSPFGQQQQIRYPPQGHPMPPQPAYLHHNGQLYPPAMIYGQQQVVYIQQYPQGMMQGQPVPPPLQGPLPPQQLQQQQQKHRGVGIQQMHYPSGASAFLPGQNHLPQPQLSHLHNSHQQSSGSLPPPATQSGQQPQGMVLTGNPGIGNGVRGGKGGVGSISQQH